MESVRIEWIVDRLGPLGCVQSDLFLRGNNIGKIGIESPVPVSVERGQVQRP